MVNHLGDVIEVALTRAQISRIMMRTDVGEIRAELIEQLLAGKRCHQQYSRIRFLHFANKFGNVAEIRWVIAADLIA